MKTATTTGRARGTDDASELQEVLTRYIDSRNGYQQAAELVDYQPLANQFRTIAGGREKIANEFAAAIEDLGCRPDISGSTEARIHRWWVELRKEMSGDEIKAVLSECLRGEEELARTVESVLDDEHFLPAHRPMLESAETEILATKNSLEAVLDEL